EPQTEGVNPMFAEFDWAQALRTSPILIAILASSVITFGFALERAIYYWKRRDDADQVLAIALDQARSGNFLEALRTCRRTPHPVGAVASEMIENAGFDDE